MGISLVARLSCVEVHIENKQSGWVKCSESKDHYRNHEEDPVRLMIRQTEGGEATELRIRL